MSDERLETESKFPPHWATSNLFDICKPKQWKVIAKSELTSSGHPVYGANGVIGYHHEYTHEKPTIMIGCRGSCGGVIISQPFSYINGNAMALDNLDEEHISINFLARYLQGRGFQDVITGSTQPQITQENLRKVTIGLPPLAEQTRIAAKLDELLAQVDTLKARIDGIPALLNRFRQSVLAAAVSGRLTEEWRGGEEYCAESLMLADVVDNSLVGLVRSSAEQSESTDQRVPYLKMNNIGNDWGVSLDSLVYVSVSEAETERYSLKDGDWLFNTRNSQELVGKSCVWRGGSGPFVFNNNILRARFSDRAAPDFIEIWFRSPSGREALEKVKSATTSVAAVYQKALMSQMVPLPEISEQAEIVRRVEQLFAFADQLEAKVASAKSRIDHLTQSILAKAFRGELVPQDPNDEPASVLLERIKTQRAAAPKAKRGRKASA